MKVIIAGTRTITDSLELQKAIDSSGFEITEVISGGARGPDKMGEMWAKAKNIPVKLFPAQWKDFGYSAGPLRNTEMVNYAEAAIFLWDGVSSGTRDCLTKATLKGLKVYTHIVNKI